MSAGNKIKVLVVDDSVLFRSQIQLALRDSDRIEIVGVAANGQIALDLMAAKEVDVCTLDIEMPTLDGLATLKAMKERGLKTKAIMFSSQSRAGAERTLDSLKLGAVDFVPKPLPDGSSVSPADKIREALLPKILSLFDRQAGISAAVTARQPFLWETFIPEVMVIASSTGGPNALADFFEVFKGDVSFPILIAQHMPPVFTASLATRLAQLTGKICNEAINGELLKPNQIYICPGNYHLKIRAEGVNKVVMLDQGEMRNFVRPCADYLFETAANHYGRRCLGVVLTGMGQDGADGADAIKKAHGAVMIQNQESCVVFGMPGAVFQRGNFDYQGTPQDLSRKVMGISGLGRAGNVA